MKEKPPKLYKIWLLDALNGFTTLVYKWMSDAVRQFIFLWFRIGIFICLVMAVTTNRDIQRFFLIEKTDVASIHAVLLYILLWGMAGVPINSLKKAIEKAEEKKLRKQEKRGKEGWDSCREERLS